MEGELLSLDQPQTREAPHQPLKRDLRLYVARRGTKAIVNPLPKGERLRGFSAPRIERPRPREDGPITTGCGQPEEEFRARRQVDAAERHRPLRHAPPDCNRWVIAER